MLLIEGSSAIKVLRRRDYPGGAGRASMAALSRLLSSSSWRARWPGLCVSRLNVNLVLIVVKVSISRSLLIKFGWDSIITFASNFFNQNVILILDKELTLFYFDSLTLNNMMFYSSMNMGPTWWIACGSVRQSCWRTGRLWSACCWMSPCQEKRVRGSTL